MAARPWHDMAWRRLLFLYGFMQADNSHDTAILRLRHMPSLSSVMAEQQQQQEEEGQEQLYEQLYEATGRLRELQEQIMSGSDEGQPGAGVVGSSEHFIGGAVTLPASSPTLQQQPPPQQNAHVNVPCGALRAALDMMRLHALSDSDCFVGMGPARLGAWLDAGGGKYSREVDVRALLLLRGLAIAEQAHMQPESATLAAADAVAAVHAAAAGAGAGAELELVEARRLGLALQYVARRRELLQRVVSWCEIAANGVNSSRGVFWWGDDA